MFKNEIAIRNQEDAMKIASILMNEEYVVMLSKEEDLTIINFEYAPHSDRNHVVFMARDEYEEEWDEFREQIIKDLSDK